jgi:hypothetical protein
MAQAEPALRALDMGLNDADRNARLNLVPYMNRSPFCVHRDFWSVYAFRLFRSMGLRHLTVVNDVNDVVGMITRKDLIEPSIEARFRALVQTRGANISVLEDDFLPPLRSAQAVGSSEPDSTPRYRKGSRSTPLMGSAEDSSDSNDDPSHHYQPIRADDAKARLY